jgi:hypothetical protein
MTQFSEKADLALQVNLLDMVREFYLLEANNYIDQDLNITLVNGLDIEVLERIVRFYCKIRFYLDKDFDTIKVYNVQESEVEFLKWFVAFFYNLESMELIEKHPNRHNFKPTKEIRELFLSPFASYKIDISSKRMAFNNLKVKVYPVANLEVAL